MNASYMDDMGIEEQMIIIRRNDFLDKLTRDEYERLNIVHNFIVAEKDAFIYNDPRNHNKLYFVKEGYVKIGVIDEDGNELVKDILKPGDLFGQFALDRSSSMMGEFARAYNGGSTLCAFTLNDFEKLLTIRPDMGIAFSKKVSQKVKKVEMRLLNLLQRDVRTRLLYFFFSMMPEDMPGNEVAFDNYLTHEEIARLAGTSRQTVTTFAGRFADEGILRVTRDTIYVLDVRLLRREARVS